MAQALGVDDPLMSRLLSGRRDFNDELLKKIAEWGL
jgi:hypothetical protein